MVELTEAGREWAEANAEVSLVASVALGRGDNWPESFREAAIHVSNEAGELDRSVYTLTRETH